MQNVVSKLALKLIQCLFFAQLTVNSVLATTPSEMADLSLQELFALSTDDESSELNPWRIGFSYKKLTLDGYNSGNNKVSIDQVLFDPNAVPAEVRTDYNFPVVPTVIEQEVFFSSLSYTLDDASNISVNIPFIRQNTDHVSIVPGFDEFNLDSSDIGDVTLNYGLIVERWSNQQLSLSLGVSVPIGSIDQKGDTPRPSENNSEQLPYTMQIGSGTWDIPIGISYQANKARSSWGINLLSKIRVGKNERDYRLGNRLAVSGWSKWQVNDIFQPLVKLTYQNWGAIKGQDDDVIIPGPFPYPAAITNPRYYGGEKINLALGVETSLEDQNISFEYSIPVYQNLNGVQNKEDFNFSISWNTNF